MTELIVSMLEYVMIVENTYADLSQLKNTGTIKQSAWLLNKEKNGKTS